MNNVLKLCIVFCTLLVGSAVKAQSMSIQDCIDYALNHAPGLQRRQLSHTNQVMTVGQAETKFLPVFALNDAYTDTSGDNTVEGAIEQTFSGDWDLRVSANQKMAGQSDQDDVVTYAARLSKVLLGGGSVLESKLPLRKARLDEAIQWNLYSQERRRLTFSVATAYYAVVRNQETLRLRELQLQRAKRNLEHAEIRQEPLDIATAKLQIPASELDVLRVKRAITNALYGLREEIGMPMDLPITIRMDVRYQPESIEEQEDLAFALEEHELIRNALIDVEKATLDYRVAHTKELPEVGANVSVRDGDELEEPDARAAVTVTWPWGDRFDRLAAAKSANAVRTSELALFDAQQTRSRSVRSLALRVREAERAVELQEERLRVLQQQLDLYQDRWDNGEIDILEFIRSQNDLENAKVILITQKTQYMELLAEYRYNVGK